MVEYINDQGPRIGERELVARIIELESRPFRKFGTWAKTVRIHARIAWREFPGKDHSHITTLAQGH